MYSPELQSRLAVLRQKVADGSITDDELTEAYRLLRQERKSATENARKRASKATAPSRSGDDLLAELEGL